jgi:hypothetical protein
MGTSVVAVEAYCQGVTLIRVSVVDWVPSESAKGRFSNARPSRAIRAWTSGSACTCGVHVTSPASAIDWILAARLTVVPK